MFPRIVKLLGIHSNELGIALALIGKGPWWCLVPPRMQEPEGHLVHVLHPRGHTPFLVAEGTAVALFTENLLFARSWGESGGPHRGSLCPHG